MANNVTYGNTTYNLNDPQECASYIRVLQTDNAQLAQQAPIQLTRDQFQAYAVQAVNAVLPQPNQRGDPSTVVNPVTTAKTGTRTYYEYEAPPAGWDKDAKEETIEPWNGTKIDVTPFLNRVQSVIIQRPRALAYTFQKILFVLRHLKNTIAQQWAVNVKDALTNKKNNEFYFDNWTEFKDEFKKRLDRRAHV